MLLSFDQLPAAVADLSRKVDYLTDLLTSQATKPLVNESNEPDLITIEPASKLVKLAKPTIYGLVSRDQIPFMKRKGSKRLYFSRKELEAWIREGRNKTVAECTEEVYADLKQQAR